VRQQPLHTPVDCKQGKKCNGPDACAGSLSGPWTVKSWLTPDSGLLLVAPRDYALDPRCNTLPRNVPCTLRAKQRRKPRSHDGEYRNLLAGKRLRLLSRQCQCAGFDQKPGAYLKSLQPTTGRWVLDVAPSGVAAMRSRISGFGNVTALARWHRQSIVAVGQVTTTRRVGRRACRAQPWRPVVRFAGSCTGC